jgi:DNA-binding Lrp family transcriptional regulator
MMHHPPAISLFDYKPAPKASVSNMAPLTDDDRMRLSTQATRVLKLMADREWRTLRAIATHVGASEAGASARLRDLRKKQYGAHIVERRRVPGSALYEYRVL